ncbi:MAG: gluconate 2-dehydrogenase subunit 3 family protein [Acidobacteriota bacterium]
MSASGSKRRALSRRALLKAAGAAAAGAAAGAGGLPSAAVEAGTPPSGDTTQAPPPSPPPTRPREPLQALSAAEADLLDAVVDRLIPAEAGSPGAVDAGAVRYIDRALAGGLSHLRETYRTGLAALDRYATMTRGRPFRELGPTDQDSVLIDVETGGATWAGAGFDGSSAAFFALLLAHTRQGMFGDPFYGGNINYIGWDLIGYPGVRLSAGPDDQRIDVKPAPSRRSAYDTDMFTRAVARGATRGGPDGDPA